MYRKSKNQIPRTNNQVPRTKNQEPSGIWNLVLGSSLGWNLVLGIWFLGFPFLRYHPCPPIGLHHDEQAHENRQSQTVPEDETKNSPFLPRLLGGHGGDD